MIGSDEMDEDLALKFAGDEDMWWTGKKVGGGMLNRGCRGTIGKCG